MYMYILELLPLLVLTPIQLSPRIQDTVLYKKTSLYHICAQEKAIFNLLKLSNQWPNRSCIVIDTLFLKSQNQFWTSQHNDDIQMVKLVQSYFEMWNFWCKNPCRCDVKIRKNCSSICYHNRIDCWNM